MLKHEKHGDVIQTEPDKRKYLFLRQTQTLNGFLKTGAISKAQYDFSYSGLVKKMNVTQKELAEWLDTNNQ